MYRLISKCRTRLRAKERQNKEWPGHLHDGHHGVCFILQDAYHREHLLSTTTAFKSPKAAIRPDPYVYVNYSIHPNVDGIQEHCKLS